MGDGSGVQVSTVVATTEEPILASVPERVSRCHYPNPVRGMKCVYCHEEHPR